MQEIIVIDWRGVAKNLSYSIMSGAIACAYPTEPEEIGHRLMKALFCVRAEHPDAIIYLANDKRPYWRHGFMVDWYSARGREPVVYKGNRDKVTWPFQTATSDMEALYSLILSHGASSIGATIIQDVGLEADDIWGLISATYPGKVLGWSADSDWRQCIKDNVRVYDFTTDTMHTEAADIRVKWIGGDSGDNIPGCVKLKKDGTPAQKGWGKDGATKKLMEEDPWKGLDPEELERNYQLTTLPPPSWDLDNALEHLCEVMQEHERVEDYWDRYGITEPVRKHLQLKANRDAFIGKLRMHLLTQARAAAAPIDLVAIRAEEEA